MVSKVAVIALVAIVAAPILLGYAFNVQEVTETEYKATGESVNVTQLLKTESTYTYAYADIYSLNTNFETYSGSPILPLYENFISTSTSFPLRYYQYPTGTHAFEGVPLSNYEYYYFQSTNEGSGGTITVTITKPDNSVTWVINELKTFYYFNETDTFYYTNLYNGWRSDSLNVPDGYVIRITDTGGYTGTCTIEWIKASADPALTYVDFASGFRMTSLYKDGTNPYTGSALRLPDYSNSILLTFDLSSITDASYQFNLGYVSFTKTTTAGDVTWIVRNIDVSDPFDEFEIYYDETSSNNTYQMMVTADPNGGVSVGSGMYSYPINYDLRYVGQWPSDFGEANYYQQYSVDSTIIKVGQLNLNRMGINKLSEFTPVMRVDSAYYRAFEHPIMENKTYDPAAFRTNPATTINNPTQYGSSIEFGGNTYAVKNGNITLGTHQIPVKGLVLSSVPDGNGAYENRIGETVISTTADPSTIIFNGKWLANISTISLEPNTVTKTEWVAGSFAWDGIDDNFLLCGMVTCIAAFIGCGIYAKKTGSGGIIPVMIVCGCAALMFFWML